MVHVLKGSSQRSWVHHLGRPHTGGSTWQGDSPPHDGQDPGRIFTGLPPAVYSLHLTRVPKHQLGTKHSVSEPEGVRAGSNQNRERLPCWAGKTEHRSKAGHGKATPPPWLPRPPMLTLSSPSATRLWGSALTFFRAALNSQRDNTQSHPRITTAAGHILSAECRGNH